MLTAERLREVLEYDPTSGVFIQVIVFDGRGSRWKPGRVCGHVSKQSGYLTLRIAGKLYQAHRLAWLYLHGSYPAHQIDHLNGVRTDNRIANLRDVPNAINRQNLRKPRSDNETGYQGVTLDKRRGVYWARVRLNGVTTHLGCFDDPVAAHEAYLKAKRRMHVGCTI